MNKSPNKNKSEKQKKAELERVNSIKSINSGDDSDRGACKYINYKHVKYNFLLLI
jgi:hypothetical protein